jgi:serine/threonine protein kinase
VPHFTAKGGHGVLERFLREARAAAALEHPNICPVYEVDAINGIHYLAMAYIDGKPLSHYLRRGKRHPLRKVVALVRELAQALHEAHQRGVVHRDLKPANIMLNQRGRPIIMDFGLARWINKDNAHLTQLGTLLGTPAYMAPEQVAGDLKAIGPATDIYSLGVILYELLTGVLPFPGDDPMAVLLQVATEEPPLPSLLRPGLDPHLEAVCLQAMAKQPGGRYASMAAFAAALHAYQQSLGPPSDPAPVKPSSGIPASVFKELASPQQPAYDLPRHPAAGRGQRRARRRRRMGAVVTVAVVLVLLGLLGVGYYLVTNQW